MYDFPSQAAHGRRHFLKLVGLAGLWSPFSSALVAKAQTKPETQSTKPPATTSTPADSLKAAPAKPPEPSEDARDLAAIIRRRYGRYLSPDQLEAVTQELDNRVQGGRRLRDAKLRNADEPDVTFHA